MLNNSLYDTLVMAKSINNVDPKDFVVMAKKIIMFGALIQINKDLKFEDVFSDDEVKFFELISSSGDVLFLNTLLADIKFAEGNDFISHELADELSAKAKGPTINDCIKYSNLVIEIFGLLDAAAIEHGGKSLQQLQGGLILSRFFDK